jgi:hypothetical protein
VTPLNVPVLATRPSGELSLSPFSTLHLELSFTSHQMHFDPIDFLIKTVTVLAVFAIWNVPALFDLIWP